MIGNAVEQHAVGLFLIKVSLILFYGREHLLGSVLKKIGTAIRHYRAAVRAAPKKEGIGKLAVIGLGTRENIALDAAAAQVLRDKIGMTE